MNRYKLSCILGWSYWVFRFLLHQWPNRNHLNNHWK
jgi:hypothetical protein